MKRNISLIFALVFALCLCACGAAEPAPETAATTQATEATTIPTTEATEPPTEETVPEGILPDGSFSLEKEITGNGARFSGNGLEITVEDQRKLTVTLSNIEVKDSYLTNRADSEQGYAEYRWGIKFCDEETPFEISTTSFAFNPGEEREKTIYDMQTSFWMYDPGTEYWYEPCDVQANRVRFSISHTPNSITWQCLIPEIYVDMNGMASSFLFDYESLQTIETIVRNVPEGIKEMRTYTVQ